MIITNWEDQPVKQNPNYVDVRALYNCENAQDVHIILQSGQQLKQHITPVEVFFFIIKGTLTVLVGDEMVEVVENVLVESPEDIVHCLYNKSDKPARILVIKASRQVSNARFLKYF